MVKMASLRDFRAGEGGSCYGACHGAIYSSIFSTRRARIPHDHNSVIDRYDVFYFNGKLVNVNVYSPGFDHVGLRRRHDLQRDNHHPVDRCYAVCCPRGDPNAGRLRLF